MANVYVYDAIAIAAGVLPNHWMRAANYNHVTCFAEEFKKVIFSCGSPFVKCMNLHCNICSGNFRLRELVRLKLQF